MLQQSTDCLTFDKDIVRMVFWNQPLCLHAMLSSVLLADIWSTARAPVVHLLLHTLQTLVQPVPLQQASQLVLWKVSGPLREWISIRRHWSMSEELSRPNHSHFKTFKNKNTLAMTVAWEWGVPLEVCETWCAVFWKTLSCLWGSHVSFQEAGWQTPLSWCPLSWGLHTLLPETWRTNSL